MITRKDLERIIARWGASAADIQKDIDAIPDSASSDGMLRYKACRKSRLSQLESCIGDIVELLPYAPDDRTEEP